MGMVLCFTALWAFGAQLLCFESCIYERCFNLFFCQQGLETIKLEMEDVGEPLVDVNFGHGRYGHTNCNMKIVFCMGLNIMIII